MTSFFFRRDSSGDLPLAEENANEKGLADSTGLLSLLEMLLKKHEG